MPSPDHHDFVDEAGQKVPVAYDVDVAVAGCGVAGSMAAIAAGRQGAKTLVVDRFGQLGGNLGPGGWPGGDLHLALNLDSTTDQEALLSRMGMGGVAEEFHRRVIFARPGADRLPDEVRRELERKQSSIKRTIARPRRPWRCHGGPWSRRELTV